MNVPENIFYTKDHEWIKIDNNIATIGITDYAQGELGDIIFLEFPQIGLKCLVGDSIGTIEAVKTVADIYSPIEGTVKEINIILEDGPENINKDPYISGWILKIKIEESTDRSHLLSHTDYIELVS